MYQPLREVILLEPPRPFKECCRSLVCSQPIPQNHLYDPQWILPFHRSFLAHIGISHRARLELFGGRGPTIGFLRCSPAGVVSTPAVVGKAARNCLSAQLWSDGGSGNIPIWVSLVFACPCRDERHQCKDAAKKSDVLHDYDLKQGR